MPRVDRHSFKLRNPSYNPHLGIRGLVSQFDSFSNQLFILFFRISFKLIALLLPRVWQKSFLFFSSSDKIGKKRIEIANLDVIDIYEYWRVPYNSVNIGEKKSCFEDNLLDKNMLNFDFMSTWYLFFYQKSYTCYWNNKLVVGFIFREREKSFWFLVLF